MFNLLFFQNEKPPKFGGQEVDDNPKNCVLILYIRNPPDPGSGDTCRRNIKK